MTERWVISIIGRANGAPDPNEGRFVKEFDPEFAGGMGYVVTTNYIDDAKFFEAADAAWRFWRQPSETRPLRADGKPNRPLTAYSVNILKVAVQ